MRGPAEAGPLVSCVLSALLPRVALRGGRPPTPHHGKPARRPGQVSQPRLPPPLPPTSANNLLEASDGGHSFGSWHGKTSLQIGENSNS
jgi:hypothetical protein